MGDPTTDIGNSEAAASTNGVGIQVPGIEPPTPPFSVYKRFQLQTGAITIESLTPEERTGWEAYVAEYVEYEEEISNALGLVDLAAIWDKDANTEMLTSRLIRNEFHDVFGPSGTAKTWIVLHDVLEVLGKGMNVIWVDQEMGRMRILERLKTLEFDPEQVRGHFTYLEYPAFMDLSKQSRALWGGLIEERGCDLAVFDSLTPCFGVADVNENHGTEVARWQQAYVAPILRTGGSAVVLDHTGWTQGGRPAGSRQKFARTRLEYGVKPVEGTKIDRDSVGEITLTVTKNTGAAPVPPKDEECRYRIGGDGTGGFIFEKADPAVDAGKDAGRAEKELKVRTAIVEVLKEHGALNQTQLLTLVRGRLGRGVAPAKARFDEIAAGMAQSSMWQVTVTPKGRSLDYSLNGDAD